MGLSSGSRAAAAQDRTISPRRTTRRHFYAGRGTWDRVRIIAAAQEWAREVGAPPRSYEWCPSSGRSIGRIGDEEHRWEREHPRWPGNTTVYRFFASWADLLEAAGLPPYAQRPSQPLAERIEAVRRLHEAGLTNKAIARELGFTETTVSRYLRARSCCECASPVVGGGKLCHRCATRRANPQRWTAEELLEAVTAWSALEGSRPRQSDWRPAPEGELPGRWEREWPRWPPASAARLAFGSWNAMLVEAGADAYNLPWAKEDVIDALQAFAERHGRAPSKTELERPPAGYPSAPTVRRRFGSFTAGLRAAGLEPVGARRWSDREIVEALCDARDRVGCWPTFEEWRHTTQEHPASATVVRRFGSWRAAIAAAAD